MRSITFAVSLIFSSLMPSTQTQSVQLTAVSAPAPGDPNCQGSACLNIYNVRFGTRCGTSDSIEAAYSNDSRSQYLRGYVVFNTPNGKSYNATGLMKPGQKMEGNPEPAFVCHGSGTPTGIANTGPDPDHTNYPTRN